MPALTEKSITCLFSKKWNSVRGSNNVKTDSIIVDAAVDSDAVPNTSYNEKTVPESVVVSDTSSEDEDNDSGDDEDAKKYGYGDTSPDTDNDSNNNLLTKAFPKRLSTRNSIRQQRRSSNICRQTPLSLNEHGNDDDDENLPFDPQRAPRRSSIKGSCPQRARAARRRAHIATCTASIPATSIEEELASGKLQPSQVLEIRVPGRRESIKRRRSITFNDDVNVLKIQAISKVEGADKNELWFQTNEYIQIKKKTRDLLRKVDSNGAFNGKKYCTRGLERYMQDPKIRASKQFMGWDSVFMEQEMQRSLQIYDDESIGRFYKQTSCVDVVEATNRANLDAKEVASFYTNKTTRTTLTTTKSEQTTQSQSQTVTISTVATIVATTAAGSDDNEHVPDMTGLRTKTTSKRRGRHASVA